MQDIQFGAALKSAKLIARKHPDKPDTIIRRVQFALRRDFGHEEAEFLGQIGIELLNNLKARNLNKGEIPINGYHAKAKFHGMAGTATAEIDGLVASAVVTGKEDKEYEEITFNFEAPCEGKLLTFFGLSISEFIECDIQRMQQELPLTSEAELGKKLRDGLAKSMPKGASMTMEFEGGSATIEGTGDGEGADDGDVDG